MRSDRLLALTLLMADGRMHTARELARLYEVSERTVYRDMDALCQAGIPVEAIAGKDGGYRITEGWRIDRSVLSRDELPAVVAALSGIQALSGGHSRALNKMRALLASGDGKAARQWLYLELSPGKRESALLQQLRHAIEERRVARIFYRDSEGAITERRVEPIAIVYTWNSWYLHAWCRLRDGFRLFKLIRITDLRLSLETFPERLEENDRPWHLNWEDGPVIKLELRFFPVSAGRADEYFDESAVEKLPDGGRLVHCDFPVNEWTYGFLLGFGAGLEVLAPEHVRKTVAERARAIIGRYADGR
jgi:predicted DNA-binding transcriptional regulator YafY